MHSNRTRVALVAALFGLAQCVVGDGGSDESRGCDAQPSAAADGGSCPTASGPVYGLDAVGRVAITAAEAWPSRGAEPAALTPAEIAGACAVLLACRPELIADAAYGISLCTTDVNMWEERAVPTPEIAERWSLEARALIAAQGDCAAVRAIETKRPSDIVCEEAGCYTKGSAAPTVTCTGDVATFSGAFAANRDCARAFARCDTSSPTGCTDRPLSACDPKAMDRCDGDIKLGCDHCGLTSFHDCARQGGTCVESATGASCAYPDAGVCTAADQRCDGTVLSVCVQGQIVRVDCAQLGLGGCSNGHCTAP